MKEVGGDDQSESPNRPIDPELKKMTHHSLEGRTKERKNFKMQINNREVYFNLF